jgi:diguanylate cyclase (GGDEF)-like protein
MSVKMPKKNESPAHKKLNTDYQLDGMKTLIRVVQELSLARNMKNIQEIVVSAARKLTNADGATFVLRDGDCCHYMDEDAVAPLWKGKRFPMKICISGWVMLNHKPVVINDIYKDPRIPVDAYKPTFVKSLAMVPIRTMSPIGAIGNYWSNTHLPSEDDLELLQALADTTAVALENVKVYNELEERVRQRTAELEAANEAIQRLSIRDELTGLYNRRGFYLLAEQELIRARRQNSTTLVMFIDIDGLKPVNDQLGHKVGDHLILEAAKVIVSSMRKSDIIGRFGGDEFCIMALDCDHNAVRARLQKMIDQFNRKSQTFNLSMSIGFANPKNPDETLDNMLSRADQEMYIEKRMRKEHLKSLKI